MCTFQPGPSRAARTPVEQPGTSVDPKTLKTPFTATAQTDGQKQDGLRGRSQHPAEVVNINLGQPSVPFVMSQSVTELWELSNC